MLTKKLFLNLIQKARFLNLTRNISLNSKLFVYDDERKTTVNILNQELDHGLMINGFSQVYKKSNEHIKPKDKQIIVSCYR